MSEYKCWRYTTTQYLRAAGTDESIRLSGFGELPGIVTDIEVSGRYKIETKKVEGRDGSNKIGHGYNDAKVTITLEILPPNEWGQVKQIEKAFKNAFGAAGHPKPIRIVNSLCDAKDVYTVLFEAFTVRQGSEDDALIGTLELLEYEPGPASGAGKGSQPGVVSGPNALPIPAVAATYTPPSTFDQGLGAGATRAYQASNALTGALGLPSNTPLPPELSAVASGGGGGQAPPPLPSYAADLISNGPGARLSGAK